MKYVSMVLAGLAALSLCAAALAADDGNLTPPLAGWIVESKAGGEIAKEGEAFSITGNGSESFSRLTSPRFLEPGKTYMLIVKAKREGDLSGGVITSRAGLTGRNWTIKKPGEWTTLVDYFTVPADPQEKSSLSIGTFAASGKTEFRNIVVNPVKVSHLREGEIELGEGETLSRGEYVDFHNGDWMGGCVHRTLAVQRTPFNTEIFYAQKESEVVYKESLPFNINSASVSVLISYYSHGSLGLYVSRDGKDWTKLASKEEKGALQADVPAAFFPTKNLYVRIAAGSEPTVLCFRYYKFTAKVDYSGKDLKGETKLEPQ